MPKFGDRLSECMKAMNLNQRELVNALNTKYNPQKKFNEPTMSKWINHIQLPDNTYQIILMSRFFEVTPEWLMGDSDDKYGEDKKCRLIPILGKIVAGLPIAAQEDICGHESVQLDEDATFCLKVQGNSMINARIFDGDIVFIKEQPEIENGQIAAVQIGEEVTLKRVYIEGNKIRLHSENPTMPDMIYSSKDLKGEDIRIIGKALDCKFQIK